MNSIVIAVNVIKRLLRETGALSFLLLWPLLAGVIAVLMIGNTSIMDIGIANGNNNDFGLVSFLEKSEEYNIQIIDEKVIEEKVESKELKIGLIFPDNFTEGINKGSSDRIKLITLKDDDETQKLRGRLEAYLESAVAGKPLTEDESLLQDNDKYQQSKTAIGMIAMFIIMFAGSGIVLLLEDKKLKTFMRTFSAPVREYQMVLGYLIACTFLGIIQIALFLTSSTVIFKLEWGTSIVNVFIILVIYLLAAIGFAIGLAGFVNDNEKYNLFLTFIAVITSFLGGCFLPIEYLNEGIQKISNFMPQKWLVDSLVKLVDGSTILDIRMNLLILLLFSVVFFTFGVKTLKPTVEDL